jgi:glucokinase
MNEKVISIDIGGTKISLAVVQNNKIISDVIKVSTPDSAEGILQVILNNIELLLKEYNDIFAVAFATAGAVNLENSKIIGSTGNLPEGYSNLDFSGEIKRKFNLNVFIENDANAAAYAEYKVGSARGYDNSITITLGTGIGGGIIVNGKLLRGKSGSAAEVGHIRLREEPKVACTCGHYDCWDAYASGTGYVKIAIEELLNFPPGKKSFLRNKDMCKINSYDVLEGVNNNDELCLKIHRRWEKLV